jgi:D-3-phosphoglycerate dehydrogenase
MKIIGLLELPNAASFDKYIHQDILMVPVKDILEKDRKNVLALFTKVSCKVYPSLMDSYPNLAVIGIQATALDIVDLNYCAKIGIKVLSLNHKNFYEQLMTFSSTSEIFFWHLLTLVRNCEIASRSVRNGVWDRNKFISNNIRGLTLGIVGFGRIGMQIANIGTSLGMNIIYTDTNTALPRYPKYKRMGNLQDLISNSNVVSVNVNFCEENIGLINNSALQFVSKKPFYIINTSRGNIVDESAVLSGLIDMKISGYGTDVLDGDLTQEANFITKSQIGQAFINDKFNISITPHIGGATYQNMKISEEYILSELVNELRG